MLKSLKNRFEGVTDNRALDDSLVSIVTATQSQAPETCPPGGTGSDLGTLPFSISVHSKTRLRIYDRGYVITTPVKVQLPKHLTEFKRSEITVFSAAARRRLRNALLTIRPVDPNLVCKDGTFTVPGGVLEPQEWDKLANHFKVKLNRLGVCGIWRIERQKRGQAHLHIPLWMKGPYQQAEVMEAWWSCIKNLGPVQWTAPSGDQFDCESRMGIPGAYVHSAVLKDDDGSCGYWRYMLDHASKRKQEQIQHRGKHWGFIGKARMKVIKPEVSEELSTRENIIMTRWIKRLTRSRAIRGRRGESTFFGNPETPRRMIFFIRQCLTDSKKNDTEC